MALSEIHRVLAPGGLAILQVPIAPELDKTIEDSMLKSETERELHYGQKDHVRLYGKDYPERLARHGFDVRIYDPQSEKEQGTVQRYALAPDEKIFACTRQD